MLAPEERELGLVDAERLRRLERFDRRRTARLLADERHLAEALSRPAHGDRRLVAERCHHADREAAAGDEVQRVCRVAAMEHDLAPAEPSPARDLEQPLHALLGHPLEQLPLHGSILRHRGGTRNAESPHRAGSRVPRAGRV